MNQAENLQKYLRATLESPTVEEALKSGNGPETVQALIQNINSVVNTVPMVAMTTLAAACKALELKAEDVDVIGSSGEKLMVVTNEAIVGSVQFSVQNDAELGLVIRMNIFLSQRAIVALEKMGKIGEFAIPETPADEVIN